MDTNLTHQDAPQVPESTQAVRQDILLFQNLLATAPGAFQGDSEQCPLRHSFAPGIYVREIFIPAGMMIVGKIHKAPHPNFLLEGEVVVFTEETGSRRLVAPMVMVSAAGTKRVVYTISDTWWVTVHHNPNNLTDIEALEAEIIADSYESYEAFVAGQGEAPCHSLR